MIEELKQLKESGVSWYRMAKEMDVSYQTISTWKSGKRKPSPGYAKVIRAYLDKKAIDFSTKV